MIWHLVPEGDAKEHLLSEECWCLPDWDEVDELYLHNNLEDYESSMIQ